MDDLASKFSELLNNPEIMQQVRGLTNLLGQQNDDECTKQQQEKSVVRNVTNSDTTQLLLKLAPILSSINSDDKYTRFLHALRPLLHEPRQKKLDEASKILQLIKVLPLLKKQGLF